MRQYEDAARKKDSDLRSLVGDSYRDVLASADAIGSIAEQCQKVREVLEGVVELSLSLTMSLSSADGAAGGAGGAGTAPVGRLEGVIADSSEAPSSRSPSLRTQDPSSTNMYELSSNVKTIVDAQEAIYGYIDRNEFLSAAWRHLEAVWLYKRVGPRVKELGVFPFLGRVWPGIKGLDMEIHEKAKGRVVGWDGTRVDGREGRDEYGVAEVVDALAACGVLRPVEGVDLLGYYLEGRKAWVLGGQGVARDGDGGRDIAGRVVGVMRKMWEAVGVAIEVFGDGGLAVGGSAGVTAVSSMSPMSSMLVGAVRARHAESLRAIEQTDTNEKIEKIEKSGESSLGVFDIARYEASVRVSSSLLQLENEAWLKEVAEAVRLGVLMPLLETVDGCGELRENVERVEAVERGVYRSGEPCAGMFGELTWVELSRVATGRVVSLWEMMGRDAVVARAKAILQKAFDVEMNVGGVGADDGVSGYTAFNRALEVALVEAVECVRMDAAVFEDVVAAEFGGLIERAMGRLEERVKSATNGENNGERDCRAMLGVVRFTSMLQTQSEAYRRLLYVQHLEDASAAPTATSASASDVVLLPWARDTRKRVGAVRNDATRAWATACAASILDNIEVTDAVEQSNPSTSSISSASGSTPMYPSEWLTRVLTQFCGALEETVSSQEDLTRQSMETFKGALVCKLQTLYSSTGNDPNSPMSKSKTLQRIYDTTFVKVLFREERGDANDVATKGMLRDLVSTMDPVEWEEHREAIEANVRRYTQHVASYLRTSTEMTALGQGVDDADAGNMQLASCNVRFSYLPAKMPSRAPRPMSASSVSGLGIGDVTLPTSAAQEPEFSIAGLQGLAKAKAAEVSDLLGSFL